jgi:hypothetical protein
VDTRFVAEGVDGSSDLEFANNLKDQVSNAPQPAGYCMKENPGFPLDSTSMCNGPNDNIGWIFTFNFAENEATNWKIEFGTDFGRGAAVFVDNEF